MAQSKITGIKPVKGSLAFVRYPVGTASTNTEPAIVNSEGEIGPMFPFTYKDKLECITEYHPWFDKEMGTSSPWGRPIIPPECWNQILLGSCGTTVGARWPEIKE